MTARKAPAQLKTKGMAKVTPLVEDGKTRGFEVEYRDGRKQAVVQPETVRHVLSLREGR